MAGLGAWSYGFYKEGMAVPDARVAAGIIAFKHALVDNGFKKGIDLTKEKFGPDMEAQTRLFQTKEQIKSDGIIGPETARHLMRFYAFGEEMGSTIEIPDHLLQRLGGHESGHDPVAQGYIDIHDEGEDQISLTNHPDITQQQAWTPSFSIPWTARALRKFYVNEVADWDGVIASHNVGGFYAVKWVKAGKPTHGLIIMLGNTPVDIYTRANTYVAGVKAQPV
jgi:hypothetical protein